ncbi:hypothetical protein JRO89_XS03G0071700 [Xanthoceras sorbifolium]|uniref:GST C-terminal domain-containing protein n=1 Tax=Xanthoceras sorbifolium TaxID=99658 RepID=A0ABQ8I9Z5_9ROSI|nr:hypothetical protein JRO89_XS03G0071700 [Xanthoceras sorbifolium]
MSPVRSAVGRFPRRTLPTGEREAPVMVRALGAVVRERAPVASNSVATVHGRVSTGVMVSESDVEVRVDKEAMRHTVTDPTSDSAADGRRGQSCGQAMKVHAPRVRKSSAGNASSILPKVQSGEAVSGRYELCTRKRKVKWKRLARGNLQVGVRVNEIRVGSKQGSEESGETQVLDVERYLNALLAREDVYWKQRSRVSWLQNGDRNTRFFHSQASKRKKINNISGLFDSHGRWTEKVAGIESIAVSYFVGIFSSDKPSRRDINEVLGSVGQCLSPHAVRFLDSRFSQDDWQGSAVWRIFYSTGDQELEKAIKESLEMLETVEEHGLEAKKYFNGEKIGMVDIALGSILYWLGVIEATFGVKLFEPHKFPRLHKWFQSFLEVPVIKQNLPNRDGMIVLFKHFRETLQASA